MQRRSVSGLIVVAMVLLAGQTSLLAAQAILLVAAANAAPPEPSAAAPTEPDRCRTRSEIELEDCVEDIARWRCRAFAGKGRTYLDCMARSAELTIAASGFDRARLIHYDPTCKDRSYDPATCSVFANDRSGVGSKWCQRLDEATILDCNLKNGQPAATGPTGASTAPAAKADSDVGKRAKLSSSGPSERPKAVPPAGATNCRALRCDLGACRRLCQPPVP